jgi:hypothetical protein
MTKFRNLPMEIVEQVFDELCIHHIQHLRDHSLEAASSLAPYKNLLEKRTAEASCIAALGALCQTSKQFQELATWRLYHTLDGRTISSKWWLVARTLSTRKDLAGLVRHLMLHDLTAPKVPLPVEVTAYFAEQVATARTIDPDMVFTEDSLAEEDAACFDGNNMYGAHLAIMTGLCPNLETLDIETLGRTTAFAFCQPASMPSLRSIRVFYYDTEGGYDLSTVEPLLLAAPNLSLLCCETTGCESELPSGLKLEHLTTLKLQQCIMDAGDFAHILRLCPNLQVLVYDGGGACQGYEQFTPQEAAEAVLALTPKLRSFSLDLCEWADTGLDEDFDEEDMIEAKEMLEERRGIECKFTVDYKAGGELIYL